LIIFNIWHFLRVQRERELALGYIGVVLLNFAAKAAAVLRVKFMSCLRSFLRIEGSSNFFVKGMIS